MASRCDCGTRSLIRGRGRGALLGACLASVFPSRALGRPRSCPDWTLADKARGSRAAYGIALKRRSGGGSWILFLVSARGLAGSVRTGRDAVEVLTPLVAAAFADPDDQCVPARIVIQQVEQLSALREAVLVRDGEVLIESVPDGPCEKARLFRGHRRRGFAVHGERTHRAKVPGNVNRLKVDRPGKSGDRYVCELPFILPDSSAL